MSEQKEQTATRLYECGYVLVPTIPESEVPTAVDVLKSLITSAGATITVSPDPEYIDLAYTMEKTVGSKKSTYSQGYFGFMKFETEPSTLEQIKKSLDAHLELVRYILLKTDAENTVVFKKPKLEAKRGDSAPIDEAELIALEAEEDIALDHEKLPDLAAEVVEEVTVPSVEPEEAL